MPLKGTLKSIRLESGSKFPIGHRTNCSIIINSPNGTNIQLQYLMQSLARLYCKCKEKLQITHVEQNGANTLLIRMQKKIHQILIPSKNKRLQNIPSQSSTMSRDESREESPQPAGSEAQFTNPNQSHRDSGQHSASWI